MTPYRPADGAVREDAPTFLYLLSSDDTLIQKADYTPISSVEHDNDAVNHNRGGP
jgi:hypothetical protein